MIKYSRGLLWVGLWINFILIFGIKRILRFQCSFLKKSNPMDFCRNFFYKLFFFLLFPYPLLWFFLFSPLYTDAYIHIYFLLYFNLLFWKLEFRRSHFYFNLFFYWPTFNIAMSDPWILVGIRTLNKVTVKYLYLILRIDAHRPLLQMCISTMIYYMKYYVFYPVIYFINSFTSIELS